MKKYSEMTAKEKKEARKKAKELGLATKCVGCTGGWRCMSDCYYLCGEYPGTGIDVNKKVGVIAD